MNMYVYNVNDGVSRTGIQNFAHAAFQNSTLDDSFFWFYHGVKSRPEVMRRWICG
jgi:hypothetical protein